MEEVPFFRPDLGTEEIEAVGAVLRSNWITTGPVTAQFERALAQFCGAGYAVCLSSQTAAAELLLLLLGVGPGDEVILPAYTYTATCSVVCHLGARPVLIDCAPDSFLMDEAQLAAAINRRTKAILAVDFAGIPCDAAALRAIATAKQSSFTPSSPLGEALGRVAVVADASHSLGAQRADRRSGTLADFSCFSFHAVKNLTTAEGGAVVWSSSALDSTRLERELRICSLHGQSRTALEKLTGGWEYDVLFPGYKCNMTDLAAALGLAQLRRYPAMLARRRALIERFDTALAALPVSLPIHFGDGFCSSGHLYPLRVNGLNETGRNSLIRAMQAAGVCCNVHYKPLPMLSAYRRMGFCIEDFPNAYRMYQNEITLPLYSAMTDAEAERVIGALTALLK